MQTTRRLWKHNQLYLRISLGLFVLFAANVLAGKAEITFDWQAPFLLGDVPEYLLLMATALFFTLGALKREANVAAASGEPLPESGSFNETQSTEA